MNVAVEEMGHLTAVWNITSALGGAPRVGRTNFPLDPGSLPAGIVVKLAPFNRATLQHFIFLERPHGSTERDGEGFAYERPYTRGSDVMRLVPMGINYETVGDFYTALSNGLRDIVARWGEDVAFDGAAAHAAVLGEVIAEGAVVVYLRAAVGQLPGYGGTLADVARLSSALYQRATIQNELPQSLLAVEICREAATMFMLGGVALATVHGWRERCAMFLWTFALWDIVYYMGLYMTVGWPPSLVTADVLFLIPVPWLSQVWYPLLVSTLTLIAIAVSRRTL